MGKIADNGYREDKSDWDPERTPKVGIWLHKVRDEIARPSRESAVQNPRKDLQFIKYL